MSRFTFNFYLDIRKPLKSNRFAITVNLYDVIAKKTSNFTIKKVNDLEISAQDKKEFESIWTNRHKKDSFGDIIGEKTVYGKKLELRTVLKVKEDLLNQIIENIVPFKAYGIPSVVIAKLISWEGLFRSAKNLTSFTGG